MKKILILGMTFICILSGCGNTDSVQNTEQKSGYQQVSMEEGLELMKADSESKLQICLLKESRLQTICESVLLK